VWHISLPLKNSLNKSEAAIFLMLVVLPGGFLWSKLDSNRTKNTCVYVGFVLLVCLPVEFDCGTLSTFHSEPSMLGCEVSVMVIFIVL